MEHRKKGNPLGGSHLKSLLKMAKKREKKPGENFYREGLRWRD